MKVHDLIGKLSTESTSLPEVIAPVLRKHAVVCVVVNMHPYNLAVVVDTPGWYILKPMSSTCATAIRQATVVETMSSLRCAPRLRVISARRLTPTSWLVFPYNVSDARSRHLRVAPQECYLIDRNLVPFMTISARLWGDRLVFDSSSIVPSPTELLESLEKGNTTPPKVKFLNPEFSMVYSILTEEIRQAQAKTTEGRIKCAIEYLGAELVGFSEQGAGYSVQWRDGDRTYRSRVDSNFRLVSAGICLDGREREQSLTSTVAVMRRSGSGDYDDDNYDDWDD